MLRLDFHPGDRGSEGSSAMADIERLLDDRGSQRVVALTLPACSYAWPYLVTTDRGMHYARTILFISRLEVNAARIRYYSFILAYISFRVVRGHAVRSGTE
jgi:hypothetical protein